MNRPELYQKTVDLLLDAYNTDQLKHGDCTACAVGNICGGNDNWRFLFVTPNNKQEKADRNKVRVKNFDTNEEKLIPNDKLVTFLETNTGFVDSDCNVSWNVVSPLQYINWKEDGIKAIESTGYTIEELARVEYAFEHSLRNTPEGYNYYVDKDPKKGQFIGLTAVLGILAEIHEVSIQEKEGSQVRLEKVYAEIC